MTKVVKMAKVASEVAREEIEKWLDYKKVSEKKRESLADHVDTLIETIVDGYLVLNDDFSLTLKLKFPIESEVNTTELNFKPRIKVSTVYQHMQGVKTGDTDGRLFANVAALCSKPKELIKALETEDYSICQAVAVFFL
jgi:hypothetical protein